MKRDSDGKALLEERVVLSESLIWELQRRFYESKAIGAWSEKIVPHYITCNPWIANSYVKVIVGFLQDLLLHSAGGESSLKTLDVNQPINIIEIGAGTGRLAFYFLRSFERLQQQFAFLRPLKIRYILTDLPEENVRFWLGHEKLKPFFESGMLDCTVLNTAAPFEGLQLRYSGQFLGMGSQVNPIVVMANYLFCVIEQDAFLVDKEGKITEAVVTTKSTQEEERDITDLSIINRIRKYYHQIEIDPSSRYKTPDKDALNQVLCEYQEVLKQQGQATSFLVPIGMIRCIENIGRLAKKDGNILLLGSDKGYNDIKEIQGRVGYPTSVEGSFSFMANMDCIARYAKHRGGSALATKVQVEAQGDTCLVTGLYLLNGALSSEFPFTRTAFYDHLCVFGPSDFYQLVQALSVVEVGAELEEEPPEDEDGQKNPENHYMDESAVYSLHSAEESKKSDLVVKSLFVPLDPRNDPCNIEAPPRNAENCGYKIQQLLSIWRLSLFCPLVFWQIKARLYYLAPGMLDAERQEVLKATQLTKDNFFFIGESDDVPFELGRLVYQLQVPGFPEIALGHYYDSLSLFGPHYITYYNMALCYLETENNSQAVLEFLEKCLQLESYEPALKMKSDFLSQQHISDKQKQIDHTAEGIAHMQVGDSK